MTSMPTNVKTIMEFDVDECIKEESHEIPLKAQFNEEKNVENWTLIMGETKCPNCNNRLKSKKIAQDCWRELIKCDKCTVMTKICKERERTYTRTDDGAEKMKFIEMYGNKEKRMHTLYQSCCILFHGSKKLHKKDHHKASEITEETKKDDYSNFSLNGIKKDKIELNVLRLGANVFISHSSKYRNVVCLTNKHYAIVTSTIGGIEVCSIAEIDDPNDGESIEEKTFARCKKEGEVFDKVTSTAIKMVLGNIKQLKVEYTDVVDNFTLNEGVLISDSVDPIDLSEILPTAFTQLHTALEKIIERVEENESSFYVITAGKDSEFQIKCVDDILKMGNVLSDFRELTTRLSDE
ncbi:hypothetical protein PRIPAC_92201 [Pristionchus pacificus]|nr:hypothetical protein PRIPAC_92201 [Pristionchus pacificus]